MDWRKLRDAPALGTALARSEDLAEGATLTLTLGAFPVLLARGASGLAAYLNLCPHQHLPLDRMSARLLSADAKVIRCSNHDAGFDAATGVGIEGPGQGCALVAIPVVEVDGEIKVR